MLIFVYGSNAYGAHQYVAALKEKFKKEIDPTGLNIATLDGSTIAAGELHREISASGFLAAKRMIIIKNIIGNKKAEVQDLLVELAKQKTDNDNVVIIWEQGAKSTAKLFTVLAKTPYAKEFPPVTYDHVLHFITHEVPQRGGSVAAADARYLASIVELDLWHVSHELDKLIAFTHGRSITRADIDLLVDVKLNDELFALIDALATKNKKTAITLLEEQFALEAEPLRLLAMIIRQFRILLQIRSMMDSNLDTRPDAVARELNIHSFVAKKSIPQAQRCTLSYLQAVYRYLVSLDKAFKNSYSEPKVLLETFALKV